MTDERNEATDDVQQVVDAVKSTVDEQVAPLMERQSALDEKLDKLAMDVPMIYAGQFDQPKELPHWL